MQNTYLNMQKIKNKLPLDVKKILDIGNSNGDFYLVGGSIRDILLDIEPKDYDFATNLSYENIKKIFKDYSPKEIGKSFGVVSISVNGIGYEIAQFRKDIGIPTDRQRQKIELTSNAFEDLNRRDITINSFMYRENELLCHENAISDLKNKIISLIGNKEERILSDALRTLRVFRFMATKKLTIEKETFETITKLSKEINIISNERIRDELIKIIMSDNVVATFEKMHECGILKEILPELDRTFGYNQRSKYHTYDLAHHLLFSVEKVPKILPVRLAMLFHDIAKPDVVSFDEKGEAHYFGHDVKSSTMCYNILKELKFNNEILYYAPLLVKLHMMRFNKFGNKAINKFNLALKGNISYLFDVWIADENAHKTTFIEESIAKIKIQQVKDFLLSKKNIPIKKMLINGNDLLKIGFMGKEIGSELKMLNGLILDGLINNDRLELLEKAKEDFRYIVLAKRRLV